MLLATNITKPLLFAICLTLLAVIVACGEESTPTPTGTPATTATPLATPTPTSTPVPQVEPQGILDGGMTDLGSPLFALPLQDGINDKYDPIVTHEPMFATSPDGEVVPRLVKEWEVDSTGLIYTFNLQEGVPWHQQYGDWGEFNADDMLFSIQYVATQGSAHSASTHMRRIFLCGQEVEAIPPNSFQHGALEIQTPEPAAGEPSPWQHGARPLEQEAVCELTKIVDYTVQLVRSTPTIEITWRSRAPMIGTLAMHSKKHNDAVGEERANLESVGTGPWQMLEAKAGEFSRVGAVQDHWRKTPKWEEMIWWDMKEESTRLANFLAGTLDTGSFSAESMQAIKNENDPEIKFMRFPGALLQEVQLHGQQYYTDAPAHQPGPDGEEPLVPLGDNAYDCSLAWVSCDRNLESEEWERARKVRLAMAISIDRQKLVNNLAFGAGTPWYVELWLDSARLREFGLDQLKYEYDPARARQLLADAGHPNGFEIDMFLAPRSAAGAVEAAQAVATMWEEVGIHAVQQNVTSSAFRPQRVARTAKAVLSYNTSSFFPEPTSTTRSYYWSQSNFNQGFEHPLFDVLAEEAFQLVDDDGRWAKMAEIARFIFDNVMTLPLYLEDSVWPMGPDLDAWANMLGPSDWINNWEFAPHR